MKETLYELTQKYKQAFENLIMDEETGEIINCSIIDNATDNFEEKCENVACYIKNLDALASAIKNEDFTLHLKFQFLLLLIFLYYYRLHFLF